MSRKSTEETSIEVLGQRVLSLGKSFEGRLPDDLLEVALDYVPHLEPGIALETLCEYLCDSDVPVSPDEYREIIALSSAMGLDVSSGCFSYLKGLVVKAK